MKYPNCAFSLVDEPAASRFILDRLSTREPLSFIRLGDGEGLLLSIGDDSREEDFAYLEMRFGEAAANRDAMFRIRDLLVDAVGNADLLGIRDDIVDVEFDPACFSLPRKRFVREFRKNFRLREVERSIGYLGARRIALLHRALGSMNLPDSLVCCSAWSHYAMHTSASLFRMIGSHDTVGLISCRREAVDRLQRVLRVDVLFVEIPDKHKDIPPGLAPVDYLTRFTGILDRDLVKHPGMLFLVGGGLFGKLYCNQVKAQGGVALDVGSLVDAWVGIGSRPLVYGAMFGAEEKIHGVPKALLLGEDSIQANASRELDEG